MTKYKCEKCGYETNKKSHYEEHLKRKFNCDKSTPHKNIKKKMEIRCEECKKTYSREDTLKKHNEKFHTKIEGDNNIQTQIEGNNNTVINVGQINIKIESPEIYSYLYNNIDDLTLYEQYLTITSKESPYIGILDYLNFNPTKPKYHNLEYKNINKPIMDIYDGNEWMKILVSDALEHIMDTKIMIIRIIYNRFRCFLNSKSSKMIPEKMYNGVLKNYYLHKQMIRKIKVHLYNNRNIKEKNKEIPLNRKDPIWDSLSKNFTWDEVEKLITKMDEIGIDFDGNLDEIKDQINEKITEGLITKKEFKKLIERIDNLIEEYKEDIDKSTSSE